jgi:hypothetical protein
MKNVNHEYLEKWICVTFQMIEKVIRKIFRSRGSRTKLRSLEKIENTHIFVFEKLKGVSQTTELFFCETIFYPSFLNRDMIAHSFHEKSVVIYQLTHA